MLAQVSIEFIAFVVFLLILVFLVVYQNYQSFAQLEEFKKYQDAQKAVDNIAFEINLALKSGRGYSRNFYVSQSLYGISNFTVEVTDYTVRLKWKDGEVAANIMTRNVTGSIKTGENLIRNVEGDIYVN